MELRLTLESLIRSLLEHLQRATASRKEIQARTYHSVGWFNVFYLFWAICLDIFINLCQSLLTCGRSTSHLFPPHSAIEHAAFWGTGTSEIGVWPVATRCDQMVPEVTRCCQVWPSVVRCNQLLPSVSSFCQVWLTGHRCDQVVKRCDQLVPDVISCCQEQQTVAMCDLVTRCWQVWPAVARCDKLLTGMTSCCQVWLTVERCD